ncbi:MAG: protein-L-isoaspartate(D-aspartate) O-methyltransferase [Pseudomonadota bacterium]|nr:protein-L-isoaspartate(D-aspartate) O-methyltransferase [Pseudomonadota bacterium]
MVIIDLMNRASVAAVALMLVVPTAYTQSNFDIQRAGMVEEIIRVVEQTSSYTGKLQLDNHVIEAIRTVPRHEFVPIELREISSYLNRPLPIGNGQTISQPYIVALMSDLANISPDSIVLEIGTGSGYQAAVLAKLAKHVYTIEIIEPLGLDASEILDRLEYTNVSVKIGDGYLGWLEYAPFDAIIVTAAPEQIPEPLIQQLKLGGRLVIPVGPKDHAQSLQVLEKTSSGEIQTTDVLPVRFVPLTRK